MPAVTAFSPTSLQQRPKLHRRSSSGSRVRPRLQVVPVSPSTPTPKSPVRSMASIQKKTTRVSEGAVKMTINLSPMSPSTTSTSKPVFIPIRPKNNNAVSGHRAHAKQRVPQGHEGIPPAVAALLAVTSIPPPRRPGKLQKRQPPRSNPSRVPLSPSDVDSDDSFFEKSPVLRPFSRTVMSVLLSPPEDLEEDDQFTLGSPPNSITSVRSSSSDSVPSLSADEDASLASWSGPTPPRFQQSSPSPRRSQPRRFNQMSPLEDSLSDHPLIQSELDEEVESAVEAKMAQAAQVEEKAAKGLGRMSFKSNLTASLRVLKSAAKSFSNFSTPLLQPDDFLTRSILSISPQYNTDEKRPAFSDIPSPELRRYLNPRPLPRPSDSFTFSDSTDKCVVSIQMQTYNSSVPQNRSAACDSGVQMARPREVRENGDFLRIIVLEMNMRRGGKLSDTSQGKARFILPPRQPYNGRPRTWASLKFD